MIKYLINATIRRIRYTVVNFFIKIKKSLKIIPILGGGAVIIPYVATWIVGHTGAWMTYAMAKAVAALVVITALALVAYGIYSLIVLLQKGPKVGEDEASASFIFSGPQNVASQGSVVPVAYGRMKTGSRIISVSSTNVDKAVWERNSLSDFVAGDVRRPVVGVVGGGGGGGGGINLIEQL